MRRLSCVDDPRFQASSIWAFLVAALLLFAFMSSPGTLTGCAKTRRVSKAESGIKSGAEKPSGQEAAKPAGIPPVSVEESAAPTEERPKLPKEWTIFYGTNRQMTGLTAPYYGTDRGSLQLGTCKVSLPANHQVGAFESPFAVRLFITRGPRFFRSQEDPEKHIVFRGVSPMPESSFIAAIQNRIAKSSQKDAFVFIHGYNLTFEDACRRSAQLAEDLKFFNGAPFMFSWPSHANWAAYTRAEADVEWSVPDFELFLRLIAEKTGAATVHLIAHSMGNRLLVQALASLARSPTRGPVLNQLVLAAPDIDAGVFAQLAAAVRSLSARTTVYVSSNDKALKKSRAIHGYTRLGESPVIIDGIDTVDASPIDTSVFFSLTGGHGYYAKNRLVITDLIEVLEGREPAKRTQLLPRREERGTRSYYAFRR